MITTRYLPVMGVNRTLSRSACTSAMPRFEAPSISTTSSETPAVISVHDVHTLQGSAPFWRPAARRRQLSALARMRAAVVLPTPRAPVNR